MNSGLRSHDVDLDVVVELALAPQHREVEQVVVDGVEAAVEGERVGDVDDMLLVVGRQQGEV